MPALPPKQGLVRLAIGYLFAGRPAINTLHLRTIFSGDWPGFTSGDMTNIADKVWTEWQAVVNKLSNVAAMTSVTAQDMSSDTGFVGVHTGTWNGGVFSSAEASNVACCVSQKIQRHYRGGHPRIYLPSIPTGALATANTFTSTFVSDINTACGTFRTNMNAWTGTSGLTFKVCSVSYFHGTDANGKPILRTTPITDDITQFVCNVRPDSQRRRLGR